MGGSVFTHEYSYKPVESTRFLGIYSNSWRVPVASRRRGWQFGCTCLFHGMLRSKVSWWFGFMVNFEPPWHYESWSLPERSWYLLKWVILVLAGNVRVLFCVFVLYFILIHHVFFVAYTSVVDRPIDLKRWYWSVYGVLPCCMSWYISANHMLYLVYYMYTYWWYTVNISLNIHNNSRHFSIQGCISTSKHCPPIMQSQELSHGKYYRSVVDQWIMWASRAQQACRQPSQQWKLPEATPSCHW